MKTLYSLIIAVVCTALSAAEENPSIILQSTTSAANSGLYDVILPQFTHTSGIQVRVVAVGTGQALRNAMNGDGDVVLVHDRSAEEQFVAAGYGVERFDVMYNDFILVGPAADPAATNGHDILTALQNIAARQQYFVSRGDDSGTHKQELHLWQQAKIDVATHSGQWYREVGAGMGAALNAAIGMHAYLLTDRATWLRAQNKHDFAIHVENAPNLRNQYGVILVNPKKHPHTQAESAQAFIDWLLSRAGQNAIASYRRDGEQLFFPNAGGGL